MTETFKHRGLNIKVFKELDRNNIYYAWNIQETKYLNWVSGKDEFISEKDALCDAKYWIDKYMKGD